MYLRTLLDLIALRPQNDNPDELVFISTGFVSFLPVAVFGFRLHIQQLFNLCRLWIDRIFTVHTVTN